MSEKVDKDKNWQWLSKSDLIIETEALECAALGQTIRTNYEKCAVQEQALRTNEVKTGIDHQDVFSLCRFYQEKVELSTMSN